MHRHPPPSDVAFTPSVKAIRSRKGSRPAYARTKAAHPWESRVTPELAGFVAAQTSVFLATATRDRRITALEAEIARPRDAA